MNRNHFVYKLIPPRPTFAADMTEAEQAVMGSTPCTGRTCSRTVRSCSSAWSWEQAGAWGLAVVEADDENVVRALGSEDPAIKANLCTFDIGVMPDASVRPRRSAA